jgi:hypothetical protein
MSIWSAKTNKLGKGNINLKVKAPFGNSPPLPFSYFHFFQNTSNLRNFNFFFFFHFLYHINNFLLIFKYQNSLQCKIFHFSIEILFALYYINRFLLILKINKSTSNIRGKNCQKGKSTL